MGKIKIHEIAKELELNSKEVIQRAKCFVLDLEILQKTCELDAFALEEEELLRDKDGFVQVPEEIQEQLPFV